MNKKPFTFEEYRSIYSKVPRITVDLIIKGEDGVLLTLRDIPPFSGYWHLPGGTVYFKESLEEAAKRIAKEEVGIEINIEKLLGYIEYFYEDEEKYFDFPIAIVFLCKPLSENTKVNEQAIDVKYFSKLPENIIPEQKKFLEKQNLV